MMAVGKHNKFHLMELLNKKFDEIRKKINDKEYHHEFSKKEPNLTFALTVHADEFEIKNLRLAVQILENTLRKKEELENSRKETFQEKEIQSLSQKLKYKEEEVESLRLAIQNVKEEKKALKKRVRELSHSSIDDDIV